jgi:hypothetical protein
VPRLSCDGDRFDDAANRRSSYEQDFTKSIAGFKDKVGDHAAADFLNL